jgi:hypothetical protein
MQRLAHLAAAHVETCVPGTPAEDEAAVAIGGS